MIVVTGSTGRVGIAAAVEVLRAGGTALDAVVAGNREVESSLLVDSVGVGGLPNILGQVELDAGLMEGRHRAVGAVAAVRGYAHPISIARQVLERLPHVLLVGPGAERFAQEIGEREEPLLTPPSAEAWRRRLVEVGLDPDTIGEQPNLSEAVARVLNWRRSHGTVDFLAQDKAGDLAVGVSTSGFAWKYPGRVGDSPIAGAGYYADNRYGAAACTGYGELAIRAGTSRSAVFFLQMGCDLLEAGRRALADLWPVIDQAGGGGMSLLLLDPLGRAMGFGTHPGDAAFWTMTPEQHEPQEHPRVIVPDGALAARG